MRFLNPAIKKYQPEHQAGVSFVIISGARTGSSYLRSLLSDHPDVVCFSELFHPHRIPLPASHSSVPLSEVLEWRRTQAIDFLRQLYQQSYAENTHAVGFKLLYYQARTGTQHTIWDWLERHREVHIIHTVRDDLLATFLSIRQALARKQWTTTQANTDGPFRLALPEDECANMFARTQAAVARTRMRFAQHPYLEVEFNALANDTAATIKKISEFLGVNAQTLKSDLVRMNPWPPEECIRNYDELKKYFRDTPWERFFVD